LSPRPDTAFGNFFDTVQRDFAAFGYACCEILIYIFKLSAIGGSLTLVERFINGKRTCIITANGDAFYIISNFGKCPFKGDLAAKNTNGARNGSGQGDYLIGIGRYIISS